MRICILTLSPDAGAGGRRESVAAVPRSGGGDARHAIYIRLQSAVICSTL